MARAGALDAERHPSEQLPDGHRIRALTQHQCIRLRLAELANLAEACRTADELDRLEKAVRALPELVVSGSTGQPRPHPLLEEVRRHRQLLERLTIALALPSVDEKEGVTASQRHARRAAVARWQRESDGSLAG